MNQPIDIERCIRAMQNLEIDGSPVGREHLIEEAIRLIQENGETALTAKYLGIKNYASFGDQREDHDYGMGPRHGSIVFRIGRTGKRTGNLGADEIYLLECCRDFGVFEYKSQEQGGSYMQRTYKDGLCLAIRRLMAAQKALQDCEAPFDGKTVETFLVSA